MQHMTHLLLEGQGLPAFRPPRGLLGLQGLRLLGLLLNWASGTPRSLALPTNAPTR